MVRALKVSHFYFTGQRVTEKIINNKKKTSIFKRETFRNKNDYRQQWSDHGIQKHVGQ